MLLSTAWFNRVHPYFPILVIHYSGMDTKPAFEQPIIQVDKKGRRRYISRTTSDSLNYGCGNYSNYTYSLPSNGYAVPNLSVYGSGLPSYDVMSRYTSKPYDTQKSYETSKSYDQPKSYDSSIGSYGYVSRSHGHGDTSKYGSTGGRSYLGTSYDLSSGSQGGSTYDGRSFGTDENIRIPHTETTYDRYRDTTYRSDVPYNHQRLYTSSKLEDYVTESHQPSPRSSWRETYNEKYGKYGENQETHRPYQYKNGNADHKEEHVSSDLEEPSLYPSYYSRYRERHKKDKEKDKSDVKLEDIGAKKSELTPSEKLALIRQKIRKRDDDEELERPSSYDLSQESTPRSLLSPVSKTFDDDSEHIPRWRQRKALEDLTRTDGNQSSMAKHHTLLRKEFNDNENEGTRTTKDHKHDEVFTDDIPSNSPLAKWRRQRQEWEQNAVKKSEEKTDTSSKQEERFDSEIKVPRPSKHSFDYDRKFQHDQELPKEKHSNDSDCMSHFGDLRSKADAVKNILRQKDSPILRSRYNEARRRQELSKDSSKDDGSETNSRTSSVDLGSSRPASSDFSDSSRPSSFIFGTDFVAHKDSVETNKGLSDKQSYVRSRANVQHLKDSVQLSDDSGFIDTVREVPKAELKSSLQAVESPQAIHEKLRFRKERMEIIEKEKQGQTSEDKIHSLLYESKVEKNIDKTDSKKNIFTKNRTLSKETEEPSKENIFTKNRTLSKETDEPKSEKKLGLGESQDAKFFRGRTHLQKFTAPFSEKDDSSVILKSFEEQPKSIADVHKPVSIRSDKKPQSTMFGQVFTPKIESDKHTPKEIKSVEKKSKVTSESIKDSVDKLEEKSVEGKISEQRKRLQGLYKKAQTTDIASLLSKENDDSESEENSTASSISIAESDSDKKASTPITFAELSKLSRVERIAKYKEERRKQLAYIANKIGDKNSDKEKSDVVPSLFLSARQYEEDKASLNRSQSVKVGSPQKTVAPVARSKSLHGETDSPRSKTTAKYDSEKSKTVTPEEEVKSPREKYYEKLSKRDHKVSISESDNEDDTIEQINARTRDALSSMIRKDVKKSLLDHDHDPKTKMSRSEYKEQERTSKTHTQNEDEKEKKSNYMFSMEKMRNKFLFGDECEKSADKISTRTKAEDDSALDKSQKRRRQLPSIPAALGDSPETRPKSSIELSSTKERSDLSPRLECKERIDRKEKRHHRRRQIYSEDDIKDMLAESKEASILERKGDFVSFKMDQKDDQKGREDQSNNSYVKFKSSSTSSIEKGLDSSEAASTPKHVLKRYQKRPPIAISPQSATVTEAMSVSNTTVQTNSSKPVSTSATKSLNTSVSESTTQVCAPKNISVSDGKLSTTTLSKTIVTTTSSVSKAGGTSAAKTEHKPGTTFAIKCTNQIIIAPKTDSKTTSTTTSDGKKMPLASVSKPTTSTSTAPKSVYSSKSENKTVVCASRTITTSAPTAATSVVSVSKTVSTASVQKSDVKTSPGFSTASAPKAEVKTSTCVSTARTPKSEVKTGIGVSTASAPKSEVKTGTGVLTASAAKSEAKTSTGVSTASTPKAEVKTSTGVSTASTPKAEVKTSTGVSTASALKAEVKTSTGVSTASAPKSEVKTSTGVSTASAPKSEVKTSTGVSSVSSTKSEVKRGTANVPKSEVKTSTSVSTPSAMKSDVKMSTNISTVSAPKSEVKTSLSTVSSKMKMPTSNVSKAVTSVSVSTVKNTSSNSLSKSSINATNSASLVTTTGTKTNLSTPAKTVDSISVSKSSVVSTKAGSTRTQSTLSMSVPTSQQQSKSKSSIATSSSSKTVQALAATTMSIKTTPSMSSAISSSIPCSSSVSTESSVARTKNVTSTVSATSVRSTLATASVAAPSVTGIAKSSNKSAPIDISTTSTISVPKTAVIVTSTVSSAITTTPASIAPTLQTISVSSASTKGVSVTASSSVVQPPSISVSTASICSISTEKSSISNVSSHPNKHSDDSDQHQQKDSKSGHKHGLHTKQVSRSKSLTDHDSPLQSPRSPKVSPRIKSVSVLADAPNLDDILMENVDYLSDVEICRKEKIQQSPVTQALSADHHHKAKRSLRKKVLQRSKSDADKHQRETESSEDKHFQEQTTEDLSTSENSLNQTTFVTAKETKAEGIEVLTAWPEKDILPPEQTTVANITEVSSEVQDQSSKVRPKLSQSSTSSFTSSVDLELLPKAADTSFAQSVEPENAKVTSDSFEEVSEESIRDQRSDLEKRRRRDKSFKRKSSLNKSEGLSGGDKPDLSSSFSSDSSEQVSSKSSVTQSTSHHSSSQHGTNDHSQNGKSVLDHLLPSKFSFPSKVSSAISKFSHEKEAERKGDDACKAPPKITRKNNFSSLLQRFSSPEPDDQSSRKQGGLRRQEACAISSASSDDSRRSTPERSQSLRIKRTPPPDDIETRRGVQRSGSFKSDFMRHRYSPEPIERRTLPEIPDKASTEEGEQADDMKSSKFYLCTSSDKPTDELAGILKQRKEHVKIQQKDGEKDEKEKIKSKKIEKAENLTPAADVDEVIENSEVLSILKARRQETDSKSSSDLEKTKLSISDQHSLVLKLKTETVSEVSSISQGSGVKIVPRIARKSSHDHTKSNITASNMAPSISEDKQYHSAKSNLGEVKSDISDIDTSLAVLSAVSQDIENPADEISRRKLSADDIGNITKALSKVDTDSPEQVTTFIKDVRRTSLGKVDTDTTQTLHTEVHDVNKDEQKLEIKSSLVHEKVEELRKSPERKSRVSPKLLEMVKATEAKLASLGTVNLKRSESYGSKEGESHRPKGILKRAASMKKAGVVVDPELATILQRRRSRNEDDNVVEREKGSKVTPSAKDDIQQSLRREQANRSNSSLDHEDDVHMPSITERIFHMATKLEETKSCPITPKSRSGTTTPKLSSIFRSGSITSQEEAPSFTGSNLLQKLNTLAEQRTTSVEEKRRSFQKRPRDDWRTRTQPVTIEELEEAGNLASVQSFRAEVLRKASSNVFEQLSKQDKQIVYSKKTEYPQHIPRKRRSRANRHKTLPITAAELGSVPESEVISMMSYRLKTGHCEMRDSKADSGILSGSSDLEGYDSARSDSSRSLSMDAELNEDDPARLSVSAKASMFKNILEKKSASGAKRYIDRKKRERSRTLPVTDDEVHSAAEIADGEAETAENESKAVVIEETEGVHDEKSKRSLAEKVQLFQNLKQEEKPAAKPNVPPPVARRRKGKIASRFSTQPVTFEEVEKAAKISPLAMSLAKPPDPEILKGLPLSAQRDIMAKHAEASLSQPGSRSSSRHGSMGDLSDESKKGILKSMEKISTETTEVHGILKHEQTKSPERDVKSILKPDHVHSDVEQRSILKHSEDVVSSKTKSVEQKGILKHEEEMKSKDNSIKTILKHDEKNVSDSDKTSMKPILKHEEEKSSETDKKSMKPILKHEDQKTSGTRQHHDSDGSVKAILRKTESTERNAKSEEVKPILKHLDASDDSVRSKDFDKKRKSLEEELHFPPILKHTDASDDSVRSKDFDKKRKSLEEEIHFTPILKHMEDKENEKIIDVKGVLKKEKSFESGEPKGILKKESSFESKVCEPEKSSMKKSPSRELKEQKRHGILHKSSEDENLEINVDTVEIEAKENTSEVTEDTEKKRGRDPAEKERYLTQPAEATQEKSPETPRKFKYTGRHKTQPITPEEKRDAEIDTTVTRSGSLKDRLNLLKQSGEEDWKKRVPISLDLESGTPPSPSSSLMEVKLREKVGPAIPRPSSIADRLNLLNTAQIGWKERVEETDAKRFTVAHKLAGQVEDSPLTRKLKARGKKESESESGSELSSPSTPSKEWPKIPFPQTLIVDPIAKIEVAETAPPMEENDEPEEEKGPVNVAIPDINDESLRSFFYTREITELSTQKVDVSIDDFNELFILANDMLPSIQRIRPKRKHQGSMKNPLKSMHTTMEIKTEYEEVNTGVAEKEVKRIKTEKISRGAGFAQAALAGLASREDFSNVSLRRTDSLKGLNTIDPYKELMLLHVKGRRRTQVRLVEPVPSSVNSGDCYILVTPDKIIQWIGEYANVIEKAKTADVATFIQQKKDLGCKSPTTVAVIEEKKQYMGAGKHFWSALGGQTTVGSAGPPEEDELYENHIVETNLVYRLVENALVPCKEYWGSVPKIEMLKKDEVIVFDFGSELYVWQGKAVKPDRRKLGVKLARKLWENGYDYSVAVINPLCPLKTEECGGLAMLGSKRPDWALFGKVNQNMETILFREKFADWPDNSRLIKVKGQDDMSGSKVDLTELKPYDANLMVHINNNPVTLVLEGSHVGRGTEWDEDMDGFIRKQSIVTLGVKVWHVLEYDHSELPKTSYGQFHDGDTYVVRWQYMITNKESKDLKGLQSRRTLVGRERCAYFFWQGKNSTINEKGASALMTVELDEERGPQVRVDEGKEIPCFLNLFNGEIIVHIGKREEEATNTQGPWKCYCVRNVLENEMCLIEVLADMSSLRSRSSFLLLNIQTGKLYVWHGCQSPKYTKKLAMAAAEKLKNSCPLEVGLSKQATLACTEIEEGKETLDFWRVMDASRNDRSLYSSLLTESKETQSIRLFHMTSVSGTFDVQEILNPTRVPDLVSPFPVLQSDLYRTSQPELFMLDSGDMVYLWHGWWPEGNSEVENVQTGSAQAKYNIDRSCAIQTAIEYCKVKYPDHPLKPLAVYAGLEPLEFTNLFPYWEVNRTARELNIKEGKKDNELTPLDEILQKMMQTRYTFEELQERPLPEGVDALRLESYLDDEEFEEFLQMTKEEFYSLPAWKQHATKKDVGLF